jgi:hypothetical protein
MTKITIAFATCRKFDTALTKFAAITTRVTAAPAPDNAALYQTGVI